MQEKCYSTFSFLEKEKKKKRKKKRKERKSKTVYKQLQGISLQSPKEIKKHCGRCKQFSESQK